MLTAMMNTTTLPPSTRRPSDGEWAVHLPRICELYYGLRYTLEDTQRIIQQETGFYATLRMYKDRIRNMAVHPKKICMQKYQAMDVVANDYMRQGLVVHFIGPSGFQFFKRTPAQITKQLRRPHCLRPITSEQARDILQQSSIQAIVENTTSAGPPNNGLPPGITPSNPQPPVDTTPFGPQHTPQIPPRHYPYHVSEPPLPSATYQPVPRPPIWNHPADPVPGIPYMLGQRPVNEAWATAGGLPDPKPESLSLAGVNLVPERIQKPRSAKDAADSYDFVADFDALAILNPNIVNPSELAPTNPDLTLPPPSSIQRRQLAIEFAAPFFLACFPPAHAREEFAFSRGRAMERFKYILTANPENQYVLPLLNWMSTVLSSNDKPDLLKDFTSECCQVLDTCRDAGFPLSTPFRYMLAFCYDDTAGQDYHGAQFAQGTQQLIQLYGADHPNVLVNEYFHAWHLLSQPSGWDDAKTILESCLTRSEKVMGVRDLITINCLVVWGRGCSENGLHAQAKAIFQDILGRFTEPTARSLQAYHLLILGRLATEEEYLGELVTAADMFRRVYEGRMRIISAASADTRAALTAYTGILRRLGRADEAANVQAVYDQELEVALRRRNSTGGGPRYQQHHHQQNKHHHHHHHQQQQQQSQQADQQQQQQQPGAWQALVMQQNHDQDLALRRSLDSPMSPSDSEHDTSNSPSVSSSR